MAYLVTGAGGFIGSAVAEALIRRGERVTGLDCLSNAPYPADWKRANLSRLKALSAAGTFTFRSGDASDRSTVESIFAESAPFAGVAHLAAFSGISGPSPEEYIRHNVMSTAVLADVSGAAGCRSFVLTSSGSVYGERGPQPPLESSLERPTASSIAVAAGRQERSEDPAPSSEDDPTGAPLSAYAASKRSAELARPRPPAQSAVGSLRRTAPLNSQMLHAAGSERHGLPSTVLRVFTCYGPRGRPDMAPMRFARALLAGEPLTQTGDGRSWRDYIYITDVVAAVLAALDSPPAGGGYCVYNVGGGKAVTLLELIAAAAEATGREASVVRWPGRPGDVGGTFARISAAQAALGWAPRVPLEEGMRRTVEWLRGPEGALFTGDSSTESRGGGGG